MGQLHQRGEIGAEPLIGGIKEHDRRHRSLGQGGGEDRGQQGWRQGLPEPRGGLKGGGVEEGVKAAQHAGVEEAAMEVAR
jgi:hypothetical protein